MLGLVVSAVAHSGCGTGATPLATVQPAASTPSATTSQAAPVSAAVSSPPVVQQTGMRTFQPLTTTITSNGAYTALSAALTDALVLTRASRPSRPTTTAAFPPPPIAISTSSLPGGTQNASYSATLAATGGTAPYTWSLASGTLPAGLSLAANGQITGTPSASGISNLTVRVSDSGSPAQSTARALSIAIAAPPPPIAISTNSLPGGTQNASYSATLAATGGTAPYTWSLASGTLPAGLSVAANGQITGTPSASGISNLMVLVSDSGLPAQSTTMALSITIAAPQAAPISVAVSPTQVVLQTGMLQQFIATVSGAQNTGVLWQVGGISGGNGVVGTITANGTYTAPSAPPTGGSVVVTAISIADNSKSGSAVLSVVAQPQPVNVAIFPNSVTVPGGQTQQFTASVTGTANTSVIWAANGTQGGDATVGSISAAGLYTAPPSVPANPVVTVTAQSSYDSNISASATAVITAPTSANSGTVYYVDCNAASDSKDGRSPSNAWKTIAHVNSSRFTPGDSILFSKGCTWREELDVPSSGSSGNPITFSSYGSSGAAPIINGADLITSWTAAVSAIGAFGGATYNANTYYKTGAGTTPSSVWLDDTLGAKKTSVATVSSNNDWYYDSGTTTLYINSTSDPAGRTIEAGARASGIYESGKNYVTFDGINLQKFQYGAGAYPVKIDGTSLATAGVVVQNSTLGNFIGGGIGLFSATSPSALNNTITGINGETTVAGIVIDGNSGGPNTNALVSGNNISQAEFGILSPGNPATHNCTTCTLTRNVIHDISCTTLNRECSGIHFEGYMGASVTENSIYDISANADFMGIEFTNSADTTISRNLIHDVTYNGSVASYGQCIEADFGTTNTVVDHNICYHSDAGFTTTDSVNVKWYNNTLYEIGDILYTPGAVSGFYIQGSNTTGEWKNNIVYDTTTDNTLYIWNIPSSGALGATDTANITIDRNLIYKASGNWYTIKGTTGSSLSTWNGQSFVGTDLQVEPLFKNAGSADFTLQNASPAINAGADLGSTYQNGLDPRSSFPWSTLNQNNYGSGWEIGAFVYLPQ
jgi:hypothetical protein